MRLQSKRQTDPLLEYRAPELHVIKGEPLEENPELSRSTKFASQVHSMMKSAAETKTTSHTNKRKLVLQTERRLQRIPMSVLKLHTVTSEERPLTQRDPIEVPVAPNRPPNRMQPTKVPMAPNHPPRVQPTEQYIALSHPPQPTEVYIALSHPPRVQPTEVHVELIAEKPNPPMSVAKRRTPGEHLSTEKDPIAVHVDLTAKEQSMAGLVLLEEACKVQHLGRTYYSCPICREVYVLLSDVRTHLMTHSAEDVRALQTSGHIDIKDEAPLQKKIGTDTYYTCQMCNDIFMSLSDVQIHTRMHLSGGSSVSTQPAHSTTQRKGPVTNAVEYTEEACRAQFRGKMYYSCLSCPVMFPTFAEVKQHALVHVAGRQAATQVDVNSLTGVNKYAVARTAEDVTASQVVEKQRTAIATLTEESSQFKYRGQIYYSCPQCPKLFSSFSEVRKHALTHVVMGTKVVAKTVVQTVNPIPMSSPGMTTVALEKSANVNSSVATAQAVKESPVASQQCIPITEFTEEACQFVNGGKVYYSCLACPKVYATFAEVRKHALFHVAGRKKYNCQICLEGFDSHQHFKVHKLKHVPVEDLNCGVCEKGLEHKPVKNHVSGKKYECPICKEGFDAYHQMKHHKLKHVTEFRFKCVICDKGFKVNTHLTEHLKTHSTSKKYQCDLCEYKARSLFRIEHHKEDVHSAGSGSGAVTVTCEACGKGFLSQRQLKNHKLMHRERNIKCPDCDKMFYSRTNMRSHQEVHNPSKDNVCSCEICGQAFAKLSRLRSHIFRRHSEKSRYKCEFCSKVLSTPGSLKIHRRRHTGEKPFACDVCDKKFNSRTYLNVHMRVHTGEKPFKCDLCEKAFSQKSTLIIHKRYHTGLRPFACEVCPKSFVTKTLLTAHEKTHPF